MNLQSYQILPCKIGMFLVLVKQNKRHEITASDVHNFPRPHKTFHNLNPIRLIFRVYKNFCAVFDTLKEHTGIKVHQMVKLFVFVLLYQWEYH